MALNDDHAMTAREIANELERLIDEEKNEPTDQSRDVQDLEDALTLIEKFASDEASEDESEEPTGVKPADVVDTSVVSGPLNGLKNFLMKKQADNNKAE